MAAIDYDRIPESVRQRLLAATYKLAKELFKDPQVQKEYEIWRNCSVMPRLGGKK